MSSGIPAISSTFGWQLASLGAVPMPSSLLAAEA
jgi:hypothetical protein